MSSASPPQSVAPTPTTSTSVDPVPVAPTVVPPPVTPVTSTDQIATPTATTSMSTPPPATPTPTSTASPSIATASADSVGQSAPSSVVFSQFAIGDRVRVQLDLEIFRMMQEGHGGWKDDMAEVRASIS